MPTKKGWGRGSLRRHGLKCFNLSVHSIYQFQFNWVRFPILTSIRSISIPFPIQSILFEIRSVGRFVGQSVHVLPMYLKKISIHLPFSDGSGLKVGLCFSACRLHVFKLAINSFAFFGRLWLKGCSMSQAHADQKRQRGTVSTMQFNYKQCNSF